MKLNDEQELAANHVDGPALVTACPGSGKTRTIVERTARLIANGIPPQSIMCITFTNKAADEMRARVEKSVGEPIAKRIWISTFHKLGSFFLRKQGRFIGYSSNLTICMPDDQIDMIAQCARQLGHELTKPVIKKIAWLVNDSRENLETDAEMDASMTRICKITKSECQLNDDTFYEIGSEYLKRLKQSNQIDFTGMLSEAVRLLKESPETLEKLHNHFRYFQIDEVQDTNLAQFKLMEMLAKGSRNILSVGDLDQCQPVGTKVLTTSHGEVRIENLDPQIHKLVSFSSRSSAVLGRKYGLNFKKEVRDVEDERLYCVATDGLETKCTSNHKWTVKLKKDLNNFHLVYLMQKGDYWRVGRTMAFKRYGKKYAGAFGPIMRARQEQADAIWVLKVCNSACDAQLWEQIISCKYGIPTTCFSSGKCLVDELHQLYGNLPKLSSSVLMCLWDYKKDKSMPLWTRRENGNPDFGNRIPLLVEAINLIPEIMQIPVPVGSKEFAWKDFAINTVCYTGPVYSLDVERHRHYIADGIITHNSIYGWRGARAENIKDYLKLYPEAKIIKLGKNYRSTPQIIKVADKLIRHNSERIAADFTTDNPDGAPVVCKSFDTSEQEAKWVADTIRHLVDGKKFNRKDVAIFYRTNSMSRALEVAMLQKGLAYKVVGNLSFFDRREVKDALAMLKFCFNSKDGISFHRIVNKPKRGVGDGAVGKIENFAKHNSDGDVLEACKHIGKIIKTDAVQEGVLEVLKAFETAPRANPGETLAHLVKEMKYEEYLAAECEDASEVMDRKENLDELIKSASEFYDKGNGGIAEYLESVSLTTSADQEDEEDSIAMMSAHASKGCEWPVVFIIGVEQGLMPHQRAVEERDDGLAEERRLMYVATTRAKKLLCISYCKRRAKSAFGSKGKVSYQNCEPSQFLVEMGLVKFVKKMSEVERERMYIDSIHMRGA